MHNRYPNRRWIFLTSGDAATGVNFNQVMETSPATCRYNVAPTPGTETFVKYHVTVYPQHSDNEPQISVFSGWHQDSPADQPTWQSEEQYPETAVQSGMGREHRAEAAVARPADEQRGRKGSDRFLAAKLRDHGQSMGKDERWNFYALW